MSSYLRWTQHPDTMHWHNAFWIDDHFAHHHYGVRFNDGAIFDPRKYDMKTVQNKSDIPADEIIDETRDQHTEIFGDAQAIASEPPFEPEPPREIKLTQSELMIQLMRCSIEYNTSITALASLHAGQTDPKNVKRFLNEYHRLDKDYRKQCNALVDKIEAQS